MHAPIYGYSSVIPTATSAAAADPTNTTSAESTPIRTNFITPEGVYRQTMTVNEYFRSNRMPNQVAGPVCNAPVRVSFLRIPIAGRKNSSYAGEEALPSTSNKCGPSENGMGFGDHIERICFNIGREIYVFDYSDVNCATSGSAKPVDKRVYKGTFPTCHDFKQRGATLLACSLLVGFSAGQIQMVDPAAQQQNQPREYLHPHNNHHHQQQQPGNGPASQLGGGSRLFNEERQIDKTAVTCLRWVPGESNLFVASHSSGNLYLYNEELETPQIAPVYQPIKQCDDFSVYSCKTKTARNPIQKWSIGSGAINSFEFSGGNSKFIATVSQDGFLRIFIWKAMELVGCMKSYFGGLLCLAWSPDLRYIATGGEDDLLSLYSVSENRVVCRGQGHKSWVAEVAFDNYSSTFLCAENSDVAFDSTLTDEVMLVAPSSESLLVHSAASGLSNAYSPPKRNDSLFYGGGNSTGAASSAHQQQQNQRQNGLLMGGQSHSSNYYNSSNFLHSNGCSSGMVPSPSYPSSAAAAAPIGGGGMSPNSSTSLAIPFFPSAATTMTANADCGDMSASGSQSRLLYRVGSVGHDCQLCLWDISEDILSLSPSKSMHFMDAMDNSNNAICSTSPISAFPAPLRNTTVIPIGIDNVLTMPSARNNEHFGGKIEPPSKLSNRIDKETGAQINSINITNNNNGKNGVSRFKRLHKRGLSLGSRLAGGGGGNSERWNRQNGSAASNGGGGGGVQSADNTLTRRGERLIVSTQLFGTPQCPRIEEVPVIEPLICKKVAHERLGALHFREDCIVTACQEGYICTWARPTSRDANYLQICGGGSYDEMHSDNITCV